MKSEQKTNRTVTKKTKIEFFILLF